MAIGDKVGYKTVREIIHYLKNVLGINKDMQQYVQSIIKTFAERLDKQGKALLEKMEGALGTVSTADEWLADPQVKSETIMFLQRLNSLPDDPETRDMLNFTKEILQSLRDGLGRNDGEFMINLSGALETISDFKGIINVISEKYLTSKSAFCFGIASPIIANVLMHIVLSYATNNPLSSKEKEELNVLKTQLIVQFEMVRILAGMFLLGRTHIKLKMQELRTVPENDPVQLQYAEILDQIEQECMQNLEHIAPLSPDLLKITQGIQFRIEEDMKADKKLIELTPAVLLDRINCFTHGDILLQGLCENTLSISLVSRRSSFTWKYLSSTYEQNDKLAIVLHKFINEIKESFSKLFDVITKTQINTQLSLCQALTVIFSDEKCDYELYFPAISSELAAAHQHYHHVLNKEHVRDLLRAEDYKGLSEDNGLYDLLINLLRKRAFFEVSHQLFSSLRYPYNIFTEMKIGAFDVYNALCHPFDTIKNMAVHLCHPIQTPCQIGEFFFNHPIRALTSTGLIVGGITSVFFKFSTTTRAALNPGIKSYFHIGARDSGRESFRTLELTPETYALLHGNTFENVATVASVTDSSFSTTVLARAGAITSAIQ